jgi:hypothetical protein
VSERLGEIGETLARLMEQPTCKRLGKVLASDLWIKFNRASSRLRSRSRRSEAERDVLELSRRVEAGSQNSSH